MKQLAFFYTKAKEKIMIRQFAAPFGPYSKNNTRCEFQPFMDTSTEEF